MAAPRVRPRPWITIATAAVVLTSLTATAGATAPGNLPQTNVEPSFVGPFTSQMRLLWRAIQIDSPSLASTVFFPRSAYVQMKTGAIPNPSGDYSDRLVSFYDLDLAAYHRLVTATSTLVKASVNPADAEWIPAGVCENKIGYWHVPGVRLVFRRGTKIESVAVASLISWRGVWYVVHLGPNPRPTNVGTVDDFQVGPGTPGPAGGC